MIAPRTNYCLSRIDQPLKKNHGWYVRIQHERARFEKYFPDKKRGGRSKALKAAKQWRDEVLSKMPKRKQEAAARPKRKALRSGVTGVTHVVSKVGDKRLYQYWQAAWENADGKRSTAKFSIGRYGKERALEMAIKARNKAVREVGRILRERKKAA